MSFSPMEAIHENGEYNLQINCFFFYWKQIEEIFDWEFAKTNDSKNLKGDMKLNGFILVIYVYGVFWEYLCFWSILDKAFYYFNCSPSSYSEYLSQMKYILF